MSAPLSFAVIVIAVRLDLALGDAPVLALDVPEVLLALHGVLALVQVQVAAKLRAVDAIAALVHHQVALVAHDRAVKLAEPRRLPRPR